MSYFCEENLPFNKFGKGELHKSDHGIQNPISEPLLIINRRLAFNSSDGCIPTRKPELTI